MRIQVALAATIATAAAAGAAILPAAASADDGYIPACSPGCVIVVNNTADLPDLHPGDGRCRAANGRCTLRAAVQEANALPRHSAILVNPGVYTLTRHGLDDTADRGDLDLHFDGEVVGSGQGRTIVDGNGADRVFDLHQPGERVAHLAVRNGVATDGPGGGIRSSPLDYLEYLYVIDNTAVPGGATDSGRGGGIAASDGTIRFSTIAYNHAQDGAGIYYHGAQASSGSDLLLHNHATRDGGGMYFAADDTFVSNVTISGNTAGGHGGGLYLAPPGSYGPSGFSAATIASNSAPTGAAGGVWRAASAEQSDTVKGVIVAGNSHGDCGGPGPLTSNGSNLDGDGSCAFGHAGDKSGTDPLLGPVADNGGPTMTRALRAGSPAIDAWPCSGSSFDEPGTDQRGATRPQGAACDMGAFEAGSCCLAPEPPYKPGSVPDPNNPGPRTGLCGVVVQGTNGPDTLLGTPVRNEIHGRRGNDRIFGKGGSDCLFGGVGNDLVQGGNAADVIHGGAGNDRLGGGKGDDAIHGESGNDRIFGGPGDDLLIGGPGNDFIKGGGGYDTIRAGSGNDFINATGKGLDKVDCGGGDDTVIAKRIQHLYRCEHVRYID